MEQEGDEHSPRLASSAGAVEIFRRVQGAENVGLWELDRNAGELTWTREMFLILGHDPAEYRPTSAGFLEQVIPEDRPAVLAARAAGWTSDRGYRVVCRVRRLDGSERTVLSQGRSTGTPEAPRMTGTLVDITDWARAEAALRESRRRLAQAQEIAHIGSWDSDLTTGSLEWSDEALRIYGLPPGRTPTKDEFEGMLHPEDAEDVMRAILAAIEDGGSFDMEHRIVRPDGDVRHVHAQGRVVMGRDGPVGMTGTVHDITDQARAERALRDSERRLALAQEVAGLGVYTIDPANGRILTLSARGRLIFEVGPNEDPASAIAHVHPDDRHIAEACVLRSISGSGAPSGSVYRVRRANGRDRWVRSRAQLVADRVVGTIIDITDQVESERRMARAHRIARTGTWEWDAVTGRLDLSEEYLAILRLDPADAPTTGAEYLRMVHSDDRRHLADVYRAMVDQGIPMDVHYRLILSDGEIRTLHAQGELDRADDGSPLRTLGVAADVTERFAVEEALRRSEDRFRRLAEQAPVGIFESDARGSCRWTNDAWQTMTGLRADETLGTGWMQVVHPLDRSRVAEAITAAVAARAPFEEEYRIVRPDGETRYVTVQAVPIGDGGESGWLGTVTDVTEQELRQREQRALTQVATAVAADAPARTLFALVATQVGEVLGVDACTVVEFEDETHGVVVGASDHLGAVAPGARLSLETGLLAQVRRTDRAARAGSPAEASLFSAWAPGPPAATRPSAVAAPVRIGSRLWGAIVAARGDGDPPADLEERLERFCQLVGLALVSADARRQLALLASTDHLTGLPNRRSFEDRLADEVSRARRHGRSLGLVVLDIDEFKAVNDMHGHEAGDRVLAEFARRLSGHARSGEFVARIGGEEFAWILPETDSLGAHAAAERVLRVVASEPFAGVGTITASGGVCDLERAAGPTDLFRHADVALYWAKEQGRNLVFRYSPEVVELLSAEEQRARLSRARTLGGIRAIAHAIDAKDPATQEHSERVAEIAGALAEAAGWPAERVAALRQAAVVHDVGKIGVRDAVLLKPGRLDPAEYEEVKAHALLGARMVEGILSPEQVAWVLHHHERWDGRGYPHGIAGEAIPDGARILALADALDAMIIPRPYAPARALGDALREVRRCAGAQFDPSVVRLLEVVDAQALLTRPPGGAVSEALPAPSH